MELIFGSDIIPMDIHTAASIGSIDTVREIISRHAKAVNAVNRGGWSPLMYAAYIGHNDVVDGLLDTGADVTIQAPKTGATALMLAASCGNEATVRMLIDKGKCSVCETDKKGWTSLLYATVSCHAPVVKLLLSYGADPNVRDSRNRWTPLMFAAADGHELVISHLLNPKTDLDAQGKDSETACSLATDRNRMKVVGLIESYRQRKSDAGSLSELNHNAFAMAFRQKSRYANDATSLLAQQVDAYFSRIPRQAAMGLERAAVPQDPRPTTLAEFVTQLGLGDYLEIFQEQEVDLSILLQLNDSDLKEIGIRKLGPRRKLTNAISRWHSDQPLVVDNPLEQALANFYKASADELKKNLDKVSKENDVLQKEIEQQQCLREVIEKSFAELKSGMQTNRVNCHAIQSDINKALKLLNNTGAVTSLLPEVSTELRILLEQAQKRLYDVLQSDYCSGS